MSGNLLFEPPKLAESLAKFRIQYPNPNKVAFVMMRFGDKEKDTNDFLLQESIFEAIKSALNEQGINALRADKSTFDEELLHNVLTYIFGCSFGISVFEQAPCNPNVAMEVGYMLALRKPVCLLREKKVTLFSDLCSHLYKEFARESLHDTLRKSVLDWMTENNVLSSSPIIRVPALALDSPATPEEYGILYEKELINQLSPHQRIKFEELRTHIDENLRKAPLKSSRSITLTLPTNIDYEVFQTIEEVYRHRGWSVGAQFTHAFDPKSGELTGPTLTFMNPHLS